MITQVAEITLPVESWDKLVEVLTYKECRRAEDKQDITIKFSVEDATGIGSNIYVAVNDRQYDITDYGNW